MKKRMLSLVLALLMVFGPLPMTAFSSGSYSDVASDAWYAEAVDWAGANNITTGVGNGRFAPDGNCTRAHVVTFLWRALGEPNPFSTDNPFSDVSYGTWYTIAVLWANEQGITTGTSSITFSPEDLCNRGQIVTFLHHAYA